MEYPISLSIAGSDCSGGAGIQADIKTMSALGVYAASAITAITVQNTSGVSAVEKVSPSAVGAQIRAVLDDLNVQSIKIGMVNDVETLDAIINEISGCDIPIITDPVMLSSSGMSLMSDEAFRLFKERMIPLTTLLTPNIPEAEKLSGISINDVLSIERAARGILSFGCEAVLIKGGHMNGNVKTDTLFYGENDDEGLRKIEISHEVIISPNTHGTGCTLSAAIAAYLAKGCLMTDAVNNAEDYLNKALLSASSVHIGSGNGPLNHFFSPLALMPQ